LSSAKQERLKARKFFTIGHDYRGGGKGPGIKLINGKALITTGMTMFCPPRGRRGFALPLAETPHFIEEKGYRPTRDLEANGFYWFISQRTKEVFESVDPEGFAFVPAILHFQMAAKAPRAISVMSFANWTPSMRKNRRLK
jgi:hypothetical protein